VAKFPRILAAISTQRPREFWVQLVRKWETSGASQQSIAEAARVSVHTLRYWIVKLQAEAQSVPGGREHNDFVEVSEARTVSQPAVVGCRVHFGERIVLELTALPPVEWLRALGNGT
jgi:transposase-like protein